MFFKLQIVFTLWFQSYYVLVTSDDSLPKSEWQRISATCRESFGKRIGNLSAEIKYLICVMTEEAALNKSRPVDLSNCETVKLTEGIV